MRTFVTALIASAVLGIGAAPALAADPYEPNDSPLHATLVHGSTDYNGSIDTIVDEDWYVFYSPRKQQVTLSFADTATNAQDILVTGPDLDFSSRIFEDHPDTSYLAVGRGRYYVRVTPAEASPGSLGDYQLRLVPSDRFVKQACLENQLRLGAARGAVKAAQSAVTKDNAAIRRDKAGMRREGRTGRGPKWHMWRRRLIAAQHKLVLDKRRLRDAQHRLATIESSINVTCQAI